MDKIALKIMAGLHKGAKVPLHTPVIKLGDASDVDIMLNDDILKGASFELTSNEGYYAVSNSSEMLSWSLAKRETASGYAHYYKVGDFVFLVSNDESALNQDLPENLVFEPYRLPSDISDDQDQDHTDSAISAENSDLAGDENTASSEAVAVEAEAVTSEEDSALKTAQETPVDLVSDAEDIAEKPDHALQLVEGESVVVDEGISDDEDSEVTEEEQEQGLAALLLNPKVIFSLIGFLMLSVVVSWLLLTPIEETGIAFSEQECEQGLRQLVDQQQYAQIEWRSVKTAADGSPMPTLYSISGYLLDKRVHEKLQADLQQLQCPVMLSGIYYQSDIINNIKTYLPIMMRNRVEVAPDHVKGVFRITGYASEQQAWLLAKNRMLQDVPGLLNINDQVDTADTHLQRLNTLLNKYELNGYIHLKVQNDTIVTNMVFDPNKLKRWQKLESEYRAQHPQMPDVVIDHVNITQLGITGVSIGRYPHIVLESGEKFDQGSTLPNGSVLTRVDDDGIILSTIHGEIKYPFFRLLDSNEVVMQSSVLNFN